MADLQSFLSQLERQGELAHVRAEVDPELEVTAIATRVVRERGPALLFERIKGSSFPLAINLLGSDRRIELALGRSPQAVGAELKRLIEAAAPPRPKRLREEWRAVGRVLAAGPRRVRRALCQEAESPPQMARLPAMKCWPQDAGRFITCGMVLTNDPDTDARNLGLYRLQVVGPDRLLMHWQIQKGGGFHYWKAERRGQALAAAVVIGGDPILYLASVAPLPEGVDEIAFAGFLRGRRIPMVMGRTGVIAVPAEAEFVLEGIVPPDERQPEGPFGDHFGHYSHPAPFPVLYIQSLSHRRSPVYLSAVVGKPPQEDRYVGNAVQEMLLPMIQLIHPELRDLWAYYEAGFHSLAVASVHQRFGKEGMKTALGLLGTGQMALTKCLILVDADVDARHLGAVLRAVREHFDPSRDFLLLPGVPFDTLDFTSFSLNLGSKMVLDATRDPEATAPSAGLRVEPERIQALHARIQGVRVLDGDLVAVQVRGAGRDVIETLVRAPQLRTAPLIAVVSEDVALEDTENLLWGIFTRFDPARDVVFASSELRGACPPTNLAGRIRGGDASGSAVSAGGAEIPSSRHVGGGAWPVYRGPLGIDATFKQGYPDVITMDPEVTERVNRQWSQYLTA